MTTFAEARTELQAAFASVGNGAVSEPGGVDPPYIFLAGDGGDTEHIMAGKFLSTWRIVLVAGGWADAASATLLDAMKQEAVPILRALAGWRVESLGRDGMRTFAGSELLTAELRGVRMIDL